MADQEFDRVKWVKKAYLILTLVVVAVIATIFFAFGPLATGVLIEETLFGEIMKWVVMTLLILIICYVIAYPVFMIRANRLKDGLDKGFWVSLKEVFKKEKKNE